MRLFIIGNGFDLAHDLPTKYWNFREYLEENYPDFLNAFELHHRIIPGDSIERKQDLLWNDLETNLANINEDVIIEDALSVEMGLESGDVGIEDTLRIYFKRDFQYIDKMAEYLRKWVSGIDIRKASPITSSIQKETDDMFITFNYTQVLEGIYRVDPKKVVHIHGVVDDDLDEPVLGHGNISRIQDICGRRNHAQIKFDEKESSICNVLDDYYNATFKDVQRYMRKLYGLYQFPIQEIIVLGHSIAGVDLPYFKQIDELTGRKAIWKVYYFRESEKGSMKDSLMDQGISVRRIKMLHSTDIYDLKS